MAQLNDLIVNGNTRFVGSAYGNLVGSASSAIKAGSATNAYYATTAANAAAATKATNDANGSAITTTYLKAANFNSWSAGSASNFSGRAVRDGSGNVITATYLTNASISGKLNTSAFTAWSAGTASNFSGLAYKATSATNAAAAGKATNDSYGTKINISALPSAATLPIVITNNVIGNNSYACTISGNNSWAEGSQASALGNFSHAEGHHNTSNGEGSHSEGSYSNASGNYSHAEGIYTIAVGSASHVEGNGTSAIGICSHAEGYYSLMNDAYGHVQGKNNKTSANAAFVIGNGSTTGARADALVVDWNGNVSAGGQLYANGTQVLTAHQSLSNYVQKNTSVTLTASYATNAGAAGKATNDANGSAIASTYLKVNNFTAWSGSNASNFSGTSYKATSATTAVNAGSATNAYSAANAAAAGKATNDSYGTTINASSYLTAHQSLAGYVPTGRTVNGLPLSANVTIGIGDISNLGTYTGYANDYNTNKSKYVQTGTSVTLTASYATNAGSASKAASATKAFGTTNEAILHSISQSATIQLTAGWKNKIYQFTAYANTCTYVSFDMSVYNPTTAATNICYGLSASSGDSTQNEITVKTNMPACSSWQEQSVAFAVKPSANSVYQFIISAKSNTYSARYIRMNGIQV